MEEPAVVEKSIFEEELSALFASTEYTEADQLSQDQQLQNLLFVLGTLAKKLGGLTEEALASLMASLRAFGSAPITNVSAWFAAWWLSCFGLSPWPAAGTEG